MKNKVLYNTLSKGGIKMQNIKERKYRACSKF